MALRTHSLESRLASLDKDLGALRTDPAGPIGAAIQRWRADSAALRFHLGDDGKHPPLIAVLGGTGTGKSTLVNRLLEANVSATSFRRTYTAGPVAIAADPGQIPEGWLGLERKVATGTELPARGHPDLPVIAQTGQAAADK